MSKRLGLIAALVAVWPLVGCVAGPEPQDDDQGYLSKGPTATVEAANDSRPPSVLEKYQQMMRDLEALKQEARGLDAKLKRQSEELEARDREIVRLREGLEAVARERDRALAEVARAHKESEGLLERLLKQEVAKVKLEQELVRRELESMYEGGETYGGR